MKNPQTTFVVVGRHLSEAKTIEGDPFFIVVKARTEKEAKHKVNKCSTHVAFEANRSADPYALRREMNAQYNRWGVTEKYEYLKSLRP